MMMNWRINGCACRCVKIDAPVLVNVEGCQLRNAQPLLLESRLGSSRDAPPHTRHETRLGLHICSPIQVHVLRNSHRPTAAKPNEFHFFTTTRPPFWFPRIIINHKCPYDNSAPCHLITKVQPTYETCHSCPFTQKRRQHVSDYTGHANGHFQTPPLQSASTTHSCKPKWKKRAVIML